MMLQTIANALCMLVEIAGVLYFYAPLERRTEGRRWLGWLCLLALAGLYFPSGQVIEVSSVYSAGNLLFQIARTLYNWAAVAGYLYFTKEKSLSLSGYLAGFYVMIYLLAFNLWQILSFCWQDLPTGQAWLWRVPFFMLTQWGAAALLRRLLSLDRLTRATASRWAILGLTAFLELYFKWSQLSKQSEDFPRFSDALFYPACATLGVFTIFVLFEIVVAALFRQNQLELEQLTHDYEMQNAKRALQTNNDIRRLYHDMKNHLLAMQSLIDAGSGAGEYLSDLCAQFEDYENGVNTGSGVVDALLAEKIRRARLDEISFNVCMDLSGLSYMRSVDLITIFGNAVDNAIEAVQMLPAGMERIVYLKSTRYANLTVLRFSNQFVGRLERQGDTLRTGKADAAAHGIGLGSIRKAAKRYGGSVETEFENTAGWFRLMVMLPAPEGEEKT